MNRILVSLLLIGASSLAVALITSLNNKLTDRFRWLRVPTFITTLLVVLFLSATSAAISETGAVGYVAAVAVLAATWFGLLVRQTVRTRTEERSRLGREKVEARTFALWSAFIVSISGAVSCLAIGAFYGWSALGTRSDSDDRQGLILLALALVLGFFPLGLGIARISLTHPRIAAGIAASASLGALFIGGWIGKVPLGLFALAAMLNFIAWKRSTSHSGPKAVSP